jgi:hypothetical protein
MSPYIESVEPDEKQTHVSDAPVTEQWPSHVPPPRPVLRESGVARATYAPSQEHPHGTTKGNWAEYHKKDTVCTFDWTLHR